MAPAFAERFVMKLVVRCYAQAIAIVLCVAASMVLLLPPMRLAIRQIFGGLEVNQKCSNPMRDGVFARSADPLWLARSRGESPPLLWVRSRVIPAFNPVTTSLSVPKPPGIRSPTRSPNSLNGHPQTGSLSAKGCASSWLVFPTGPCQGF